MAEQQKTTSLLDQHVAECRGSSRAFDGCIIGQRIVQIVTLKARHIAQQKPFRNTRDE